MGIRVVCDCGPRVLKDYLAGSRIQCPRCLVKIDVPALPPPPPRLPASAPLGNFPSLDEAPPFVPLADDDFPEAILDEAPQEMANVARPHRRRRSGLKVLFPLLVLGFLLAGATVWLVLRPPEIPTAVLAAGEEFTHPSHILRGLEHTTVCVVCLIESEDNITAGKGFDEAKGVGPMRWSNGEATGASFVVVRWYVGKNKRALRETFVAFNGPAKATPIECRVVGKRFRCKLIPTSDLRKGLGPD